MEPGWQVECSSVHSASNTLTLRRDKFVQLCNPDMVIGSKNKMKGDIKFEGVLRIDGALEGNIIAPIEVRRERQLHTTPNFLDI